MKFICKLFIALALPALAFSAYGAKPNLPVVEILGKNYYVYTVKKGDSLFGISRNFGWDYDELQRLNPNALSPLKKGIKVFFPTEDISDVKSGGDLSSADQEPVVHVVARGETVYSISRLYGIPVENIYRLNPDSKTGIKAGERLTLKEPDTLFGDGMNPEFHTVKRGDTLYQLAKNYQTSVAAIMKLNPGISESNFKAGDVIRVPEKGEGIKLVTTTVDENRVAGFETYKVKKDDTWESIARETGVDKSELMEVNKASGNRPKSKSLITIPQVETVKVEKTVADEDPRELTAGGMAEIYDDVHGIGNIDSLGVVNVAILMSEPSSRKDLEFSRGFLTGVDKLKHSDFKIKLNFIDGSKDSSDVLTRLSDLDPDLVFLTTENKIPSYLEEYAEVSQTPVVNTFDVRSESYMNNPYIIQLLTPSAYFNDRIASELAEKYTGATLIFAGTADKDDQLATALRGKWPASKVRTVSVGGLANASFTDFNKYVIYAYPTSKDDVEQLLTNLVQAKTGYPLADITLVGRPSWIMYDESLGEKMHEADVLVPSRFYYDADSSEARSFTNYFSSLFDRNPAMSYPMYSAMGYDTALYFLPEMHKVGGDINEMRDSGNGVQSDFSMSRPANWSGLINPVVYLIRFSAGSNIDKIKLQ